MACVCDFHFNCNNSISNHLKRLLTNLLKEFFLFDSMTFPAAGISPLGCAMNGYLSY